MARGIVAPDDDFFDDSADGDWADTFDGRPAAVAAGDVGSLDEFDDLFATDLSRPLEPAYDHTDLDDSYTAAEPPLAVLQSPPPTRSRAAAILAVVGAVIVAVVVTLLTTNQSTSTDRTAALPTLTASPSTANTTNTTPAAVPLTPTTSDGPGDSTSAAGAIIAFNYAYYVRRDAAAAAEQLVPEQNSPAVIASISTAIADLNPELQPTVTVTATPTANLSVFNVVIKLTTKDTLSYTLNQRVTTVYRGNRYYLTDKSDCVGACPAF